MPASIIEEVDHLFDAALIRDTITRLSCPSCGSAHVAQVLGDNGGVSYVCNGLRPQLELIDGCTQAKVRLVRQWDTDRP
ncbi:hypothetical protein ACRAWF_28895 [Streptomyces sp. L7]